MKIAGFIFLFVFIGLMGWIYLEFPYEGPMLIFSVIFIGTFVLIAKFEHKKISIILSGAALSLILAFLIYDDFEWEHVYTEYMEWEVIAVVLGMLILIEAIQETGLFDWLIITMLKLSKGKPFRLFLFTFGITFALSTTLANVTAMILISSMILTVCKGLDYDPVPFILSAVLATEVAGMTTVVSSLPAIMVGTAAGFEFIEYLCITGPFLILTIPLCVLYLKKAFPTEKITLGRSVQVETRLIASLDQWAVVENRMNFYLAALIFVVTILGFAFLKIPIGVTALLCAILAIVVLRPNEEALIKNISWDSILFFGALFILVGTLEHTGVLDEISLILRKISGGNLFITGLFILLLAGGLTGVLDNIPVTAALKEVIIPLNENFKANPNYLWFMLVFAGAFGGGLSPFASAAGVLALTLLSKEGRPLSFKQFVKKLAPISILLLILGGIYLTFLAILGII